MWAVIAVAAVPGALIGIATGLERLEAHLLGPAQTAEDHLGSMAPARPRDRSAAGRRTSPSPRGREPATVPFAAVLVRTPRRLPP